MFHFIQTRHQFRQTSPTPLENPLILNSAVEAGNWSLVKELISNHDVSADVISQSFLLQKLATATVTSYEIIQDILKKLFSNDSSTQGLKDIAQDAVVEAAKCSNWNIFLTFLSEPNILLEDEAKLLLIIEIVEKSQILREKPCLQIDVLSAVWRYSRQTILDCKDKKILNIFVGLVAEFNMWSRVCDLLVAKPDLNHLDRDGLSVLHRLVMCPDTRFDSLLLLLLENGADINNKTLKGDTILHLAAKHQKVLTKNQPSPTIYSGLGDHEYLRLKIITEDVNKRAELKRQLLTRLIRSCDSLDDCDHQGHTAVVLATKNINWEFLKLLLANGAMGSHVDQHQRSLLHLLVLYGSYMDPVTCQDLDLVPLFVNGGAELNCVDCDGNSALHLAVQSKNWILFKSLIEHGADPELIDSEGFSVLHRLALTEIQYTKDVCLLFQLICLRDTDLNTPSRTGNTVLNIAATKQNWSLVKCLMHLGVNTNLCNIDGFTILHIAAMATPTSQHGEQASPNDQTDLLDVFDFVVNKTVDLELPCSTGDTALNLAAKHENWIVARYLIERGANTNTLDSEGVHLIQRLIKGRTENRDSLLVFNLCHPVTSVRATDSVLQLAAQEENWMFVDHVLKSLGGNVDTVDSQGQSILQRMATSTNKTFKEGASCPYVKTILGKSEHLDNHQVDFLIHLAASAGNIHVVHELLDNFDEVNRTDGQGFTVLHKVAQCCSSSSVNIIKRLVVEGADVQERCPSGDTALQLAAKSGNWLAVKPLLESGASVDSVDAAGMFLLHRLTDQSQLNKMLDNVSKVEKLVHYLVTLFANDITVNLKDHNGNTPLHLAVTNKQWGLAKQLIIKGGSLKERDAEGYTVLHKLALVRHEIVACESSTKSVSHLDIVNLVDYSVHIDALDPHGNTALMLAAIENNWETVNLLLNKEPNASLRDNQGLTVLHRLAIATPTSLGTTPDLMSTILDKLISRGVDVNARDSEGNTPCHLAAKHGNMEMVGLLLKFVVNVNETDSEGFTLLSRVAQTKSPRSEDIASRLRKKGADVEKTSPDGKVPLLQSILSRNWSVTEVLWPCTLKSTIACVFQEEYPFLHRFVEEIPDSYLITRMLVERKDTLMQRSLNGMSAIQLFFAKKKWEWVVELFNEGGYTDFEAISGDTVFHGLAECSKHLNSSDLIHSAMPNTHLNINLRDDNGNTPLNILCSASSWDLIKSFIEHGADVNLPDQDGFTVIHKIATSSNWSQLSDLLNTCVEYGGDIRGQGPQHETAVMLALEKKNWPIFWQLVQLGACFDLSQADKCLLVRTLCYFPKSNIHLEKLSQIILCLTQPGLDCSTGHTSGLETRDSSEKSVSCSVSTTTKWHFQSGHYGAISTLEKLFVECIKLSNWTVANLLLQYVPTIDIKRLFFRKPLIHVIVGLYQENDNETWLAFLTKLLDCGLDINSDDGKGRNVLMMQEVLRTIESKEENPKALFGILLQKGVNPTLVDKMGNSLLVHIMKTHKKNFLKIIKRLFEMGLPSFRPQIEGMKHVTHSLYLSQMKKAIKCIKSSGVKILTECGALSNADMFLLSTQFEAEAMDESHDAKDSEAESIRQVLQQAASQPRSLKSLCRLTVSRALPIGVNRRDLVKSLPIPSLFTNYLMFTDLLPELHDDSQDRIEDPLTRLFERFDADLYFYNVFYRRHNEKRSNEEGYHKEEGNYNDEEDKDNDEKRNNKYKKAKQENNGSRDGSNTEKTGFCRCS